VQFGCRLVAVAETRCGTYPSQTLGVQMDDSLANQLLEQLNLIVITYRQLGKTAKHEGVSDLGDDTAFKFITRSSAAIERAMYRDSK
jgi:hypothetical protein